MSSYLQSLIFCIVVSLSPLTVRGSCCPNNWVYYESHCYLVSSEKQPWQEAEIQCETQKSRLWVVENVLEWELISAHLPRAQYSWIGLRTTMTNGNETKWVSNEVGVESLDNDDLPWLVKSSDHGLSAAANCVSYYGTFDHSYSYVVYIDCATPSYYICKKKSE